MAISIFQLIGSIMVDSSAADESIAKTDEKANSLGETLLGGAKKAGKFAAGLGAAAAGAAVGLTKMAGDSATAMDAIDKGSQKMGISAEAYQEWSHVMSLSGMDISVMQNGMKTLQNQMDGVTRGTASSIEAFERLGVSVYDESGELKDQTSMMDEVIKALAEMDDGAERTALAVDLFGKSGTEMLPMLNSGADAIDAMKQEAHDLGLVFSDDTVKGGAALNDAMSNVKDSIGALITGIGASLMPVMLDASQMIIDFLPTIKEIADKIGPTLSSILQSILPLLLQLAEKLLPPILNLIDALMPLIQMLIDTLLPPIVSLISVVADTISKYVIPAITKVVETVKTALSNVGGWLDIFKNKAITIFNAIRDGVKKPINAVIGFINGLVGGVVDGVNAMIRALNSLSFGVPSWVPIIGGETFGFNLKELRKPSIPMLAEGAVLEPNKPFLAMVGDQKQGTNVEAPLSTIKQAVAEVLAEMNLNVNVHATPDTARWFKDMQIQAEAFTRRTGRLTALV